MEGEKQGKESVLNTFHQVKWWCYKFKLFGDSFALFTRFTLWPITSPARGS